jgi:hypothetical protein
VERVVTAWHTALPELAVRVEARAFQKELDALAKELKATVQQKYQELRGEERMRVIMMMRMMRMMRMMMIMMTMTMQCRCCLLLLLMLMLIIIIIHHPPFPPYPQTPTPRMQRRWRIRWSRPPCPKGPAP